MESLGHLLMVTMSGLGFAILAYLLYLPCSMYIKNDELKYCIRILLVVLWFIATLYVTLEQ